MGNYNICTMFWQKRYIADIANLSLVCTMVSIFPIKWLRKKGNVPFPAAVFVHFWTFSGHWDLATLVIIWSPALHPKQVMQTHLENMWNCAHPVTQTQDRAGASEAEGGNTTNRTTMPPYFQRQAKFEDFSFIQRKCTWYPFVSWQQNNVPFCRGRHLTNAWVSNFSSNSS